MKFLILLVAIYSINTYAILGGHKANLSDYPWQVSMQMGDTHFCGGSIISEKYMITATHCIEAFFGPQAKTINIKGGGDGSLKNLKKLATISKVWMHPKYNDIYNFRNDIALLKFETPIKLEGNVSAIKLPPEDFNQMDLYSHDSNVVVSGWGKAPGFIKKKFPQSLKAITNLLIIPAWNLDLMERFEFPILKYKKHMDEKVSGAQPYLNGEFLTIKNQGKSTCQGDSGGPVVLKTSDPQVTYLIGVVSHGSMGHQCGIL